MSLVLPIEELLAKVSDGAPCGVLDDANGAQVIALEHALKQGADIHSLGKFSMGLLRGGKIDALDDPASQIEVKALKHLQPALMVAVSGLESDGLAGFADGLALIKELLTTYWDTVYPTADEDPDDPYYKRVNILNPLAIIDPAKNRAEQGAVFGGDSWRLSERLFKTVLIESDRYGALSLRECLSPWAGQFKLTLPPGEAKAELEIQQARMSATTLDRQVEALSVALDALNGIDQRFKEVPGAIKPNFDYLINILKAAQAVASGAVGTAEETPRDPTGKKVGGSNGASTGLADRNEALLKVAAAAEYFRKYERSSPIPLLLDRVLRIAEQDFMELLTELNLGDQAVPEFRKLAGVKETTTNGESTESSESEASS